MQKHAALPKPFADLGIEVPLLKGLAAMGFEEPSEIQRQLIPPALSGRDILGQARTGTGKTAAFGLPILQQIDPAGRLQAMCLAPTRELAVQVSAEIQRIAKYTGLHVVPIYGGAKMATQQHQLGKKPHFVVGTPGRVFDFMQRGTLRTEDIRFIVLDEVDRMLDIGFRDDIKAILSRVRGAHQTILVSATIEDEINRLSQQYMNDPLEINVSRDQLTVDEIDQSYVTADRWDKFRVLKMIIEQEDPPISIVFCNTKAMVRKLAQKLHEMGINAQAIQGDLMQKQRERVMGKFRKHQLRVLVATDLAARGIDVSAITHIFNYDIPPDSEIYVHRIGRTARMGARGVAITLVSREEGKELTSIEKLINREIVERKVPGFTPRPPREEAPPRSAARPAETLQPVGASTETTTGSTPMRKTLGGRHRPSRRRRRL
jgi:ATP-dependent RNA helicase DeaD